MGAQIKESFSFKSVSQRFPTESIEQNWTIYERRQKVLFFFTRKSLYLSTSLETLSVKESKMGISKFFY